MNKKNAANGSVQFSQRKMIVRPTESTAVSRNTDGLRMPC